MDHARILFTAILVMSTFASIGSAQTAPPPSGNPQSGGGKTVTEPSADASFETIVVTASPGTTTEFRSSISVNSISADEVAEYAPRGTAEIFRNIPGVRSEAGGGNAGNANIIVRGLPAASGGAKFLQLHEDGLPVLEFGDIAFGNADIFLRADWSVERIESVRGGSASTFASNSPGGVINFISNTGERPVSRLGYTKGLDFDWDSWISSMAVRSASAGAGTSPGYARSRRRAEGDRFHGEFRLSGQGEHHPRARQRLRPVLLQASR